jgi:hypothetical protein
MFINNDGSNKFDDKKFKNTNEKDKKDEKDE